MNVDENEVPEVVFRTPLYGKAGKELSLYGLVTEDPEWACNRMVMGNHIIQKRDEEIKLLRESLAAKERECEGLRLEVADMREEIRYAAGLMTDKQLGKWADKRSRALAEGGEE